MSDPLKDAAAQLEKLTELLATMTKDRNEWKNLAELADQKLVALQNSMREALEMSE